MSVGKGTVKVLDNKVKVGILETATGISTVGAIFSKGSIDGRESGDTSITILSKMAAAVDSPWGSYVNSITPVFDIGKETSTVLFQSLFHSKDFLKATLPKLFDGKKPENSIVDIGRYYTINKAALSFSKISNLLEDVACAASYGDRFNIFTSTNNTSLQANEQMLKDLSSSVTLIGSPDMEDFLVEFGKTLPQQMSVAIPTYNFQPGVFSVPHGSNSFSGTKLHKSPTNALVSFSYSCHPPTAEEMAAVAVLESVLGGGASFSSEGLGRGDGSVLYKRVLGRIPGCNEVRAILRQYAGGGLFSFDFDIPEDSVALSAAMLADAAEAAANADESLLEAAKAQAILSRLKNQDDAGARFRIFASSVARGTWENEAVIDDEIRKVTKETVRKACEKVFSGKPSAGSIGASKELLQDAIGK